MPELPEVETIVRGLKRRLVGKTILRAELLGSPTFREKIPNFLNDIQDVIVHNIDRYGKSILVRLDSHSGNPQTLQIHLGMTGQLLWETVDAPRLAHTH